MPTALSLAALLGALLIIVAVSRVMGAVAARLGQPRVIGEIAAGVLLGPSVFGWLAPEAFAVLFRPDARASIDGLGRLGLVLFMFVVGLEVEPQRLGARGATVLTVAAASIALPFVIGVLLALGPLAGLAPVDVPAPIAAAFVGVALATTAFPVLARILAERGLLRGELGTLALACAALNDLSAWALLTVVLGAARLGSAPAPGRAVVALCVYAAGLALVRPAWRRIAGWTGPSGVCPPHVVAAVAILLALGAGAAEAVGIHLVFGAFIVGALAPRDALRTALLQRLPGLAAAVLPIYFTAAGLHVAIGQLDSLIAWVLTAAIVVAAVASKVAGSALAARLAGLAWRDALALGALMNTRGLMELVVLQIGLDAGLLTPTLYTMLVLMALATTAMTGPALTLLERPTRR